MKKSLLRYVCVPLVLISRLAFGQASPLDFQRVAPKLQPQLPRAAALPAPEKANLDNDTPVLDKLGGIVLLSDPGQVRVNGWPKVAGVHSEGTGLLASPKLAKQLAPFIGKPATFGKLQEISAEIVRFYRDNNRPVVDAQLPEQNVTGGVVQFLVVEGRVGKISAEGHRWFPESRILKAIRSREGDFIEANKLLDDLNWLNRNSFRRSELLFRKGESHGETDIIVKTSDRLPIRPYIGFDNWGTELTDDYRLQAGFMWGNAFGLDQLLSYQYSVAPNPKAFTAQAATWSIPLPWRNVLDFYFSYARSRPDVPDVNFDAKSLQLGGFYTIPLPSLQSIRHEVSLGVEYKESNNNLLFGGTNIFEANTEIVQFRLGYTAQQHDSTGTTNLAAYFFYSPGGLSPDNTTEAFEEERAGAEAEYFYGRVTVQRSQKLPRNFTLLATASGQLASGPLLASEQFSLGGATTVRGYEEAIANGDRGWLGSLEVYSPPLFILRRFWPEAPEDELKFLVFFDAGGVGNYDLQPGERSYQGLAGVGAGLRYRINTRLNIRFDYGWSLIDIPDVETDSSRAYVSVSLSY